MNVQASALSHTVMVVTMKAPGCSISGTAQVSKNSLMEILTKVCIRGAASKAKVSINGNRLAMSMMVTGSKVRSMAMACGAITTETVT